MTRAVRTSAALTLLAACSDVQSIQLGELAAPSAGASSASPANAAPQPRSAPDTAQTDAGKLAMAPPSSQPKAADAGDSQANPADPRMNDDIDDDDDEDSEESPENSSDEEDAGEPTSD